MKPDPLEGLGIYIYIPDSQDLSMVWYVLRRNRPWKLA